MSNVKSSTKAKVRHLPRRRAHLEHVLSLVCRLVQHSLESFAFFIVVPSETALARCHRVRAHPLLLELACGLRLSGLRLCCVSLALSLLRIVPEQAFTWPSPPPLHYAPGSDWNSHKSAPDR